MPLKFGFITRRNSSGLRPLPAHPASCSSIPVPRGHWLSPVRGSDGKGPPGTPGSALWKPTKPQPRKPGRKQNKRHRQRAVIKCCYRSPRLPTRPALYSLPRSGLVALIQVTSYSPDVSTYLPEVSRCSLPAPCGEGAWS